MDNERTDPNSDLVNILLAYSRPKRKPSLGNALAGYGAPASWPIVGNVLARTPHAAQPNLKLASVFSPWAHVEARFTRLLESISITAAQGDEGTATQGEVRASLNRHYWSTSSSTANSLLIGSWRKFTRVRPSRDIDLIFLLPPQVYWRFQHRAGNRQSQLLQEVKSVLVARYSRTTMRGDGQVVVVPFEHVEVEVAPGFRCQDGSILVCDANADGSYIWSSAEAEAADLALADASSNGDVRALARMAKLWKRERSVPIKSFVLERLAIEFLRTWPYSGRGPFWYDWMIRDFLAYLISRTDGWIVMPGTNETIWLGSEWLSRAQTAHRRAVIACDYEWSSLDANADAEWRQIFGPMLPR